MVLKQVLYVYHLSIPVWWSQKRETQRNRDRKAVIFCYVVYKYKYIYQEVR